MAWRDDGLHKRGKRGVYHICWRDENGHQHEKSTRTTSFHEAKKAQRAHMEQIRKGEVPNAMADWTLIDAVGHWVNWRRAMVSPKTVRVEAGLLRQVVKVL